MRVYGQPLISRETRRLLVTILVSVTALWVLARIRFQERPAASTPVPNVLAQLRPASNYADLARTIADIRPAIVAAVSASRRRRRRHSAFEKTPPSRLRPGPQTPCSPPTARQALRSSGTNTGEMPGLMPWVPRLLDYPRYLVAADVTGDRVALRPVFTGGLFPSSSPLWPGELWAIPRSAAIAPGTFVFTTEGAFAGLCVSHGEGTALVPATLSSTRSIGCGSKMGQAGDARYRDPTPLSRHCNGHRRCNGRRHQRDRSRRRCGRRARPDRSDRSGERARDAHSGSLARACRLA